MRRMHLALFLIVSLTLGPLHAQDPPGAEAKREAPQARVIHETEGLTSYAAPCFSADDQTLGVIVTNRSWLDPLAGSAGTDALLLFDRQGELKERRPLGRAHESRLVKLPYASNHKLVPKTAMLMASGLVADWETPGTKHTLMLSDPISGAEYKSFEFESSGIPTSAVAISPTQETLAVISGGVNFDKEPAELRGAVELFDLESGERVFEFSSEDMTFGAVDFADDGKLFAAAGGRYDADGEFFGQPYRGWLLIGNVPSGQLIHKISLNDHPSEVAFTPDGKQLVTGGGKLQWWNCETGSLANELPFERPTRRPREKLGDPNITSLAFSPDGRHLAVALGAPNLGAKWGAIKIIDANSRRLQQDLLEKAEVMQTSTAYSHDGRQIVASELGRNLRVWDLQATSDSSKK